MTYPLLFKTLACVAILLVHQPASRADHNANDKDSRISGVAPLVTRWNWGFFESAVSGTSEEGVYRGAELFAGPQKFSNQGDSNYFYGVLPNGRVVSPAGSSSQVGMNPLGIVLTPDGKFAIISNDDERNETLKSLNSKTQDGLPIQGGYSLTVLDTSESPMPVLSQITTQGKLFIGLQVIQSKDGYTLYASGGGDNSVKLFDIDLAGKISSGVSPSAIVIAPTTPATKGYASHFSVASAYNLNTFPSAESSTNAASFAAGSELTFPAGTALSPDEKYLYVACNGDNSVAVISTATNSVIAQYPAGYFPYGVVVSADGLHVAVTNWGVTEYKFAAPSYDADGNLTALAAAGQNTPSGFFVPTTDTEGIAPKTSSVSLFNIVEGDPTHAKALRSVYEGKNLDKYYQVGGTHPSAVAVVKSGAREILYVALTNDDSLGLIDFASGQPIGKVELALFEYPVLNLNYFGCGWYPVFDLKSLKGNYPNALAASHDGTRLYVAEGGINSVAILDTTEPDRPKLIGRISTGWWPTSLAISSDDRTLYVVNAKGVGEDVNPKSDAGPVSAPNSGVESFIDSNFLFGSVQKIDLASVRTSERDVVDNNVKLASSLDSSVVPIGGASPSRRIKTVIFIEGENKSFDSKFGAMSQFGPYASTTFYKADGSIIDTPSNLQYTEVTRNMQLLAKTFAVGVNYYSDSEESDAGHVYCSSGTATDYTEKTLLVKTGRSLLVNKNFEPEDYPANGYIFNNAARNGVSFKDYGEEYRIDGSDTGTSFVVDTAGNHLTIPDDPLSGKMGFPSLPESNPVSQIAGSDVDSPTKGLGQSYFLNLPILAVLGDQNRSGEAHIDNDYPGYNFNISDQRRAKEFIKDFDRMVKEGTLPQFIYLYFPNEHTGGTTASNFGFDANGNPVQPTALEQVEDGDVAVGMVIEHIMMSPVYYDANADTGAAIFITEDDAQSSFDHIHPHRTPLVVVSPFSKPAYIGTRHYSSASIVKTEELLLGLPPNNLGDLLATDLRDLFQDTYNKLTLDPSLFNRTANYEATPAGRQVWSWVRMLNLEKPDQDSLRLGMLGRLSMRADRSYKEAKKRGRLGSLKYRHQQKVLVETARELVSAPAPGDPD
jgi:YVTN family beta-propeller protein